MNHQYLKMGMLSKDSLALKLRPSDKLVCEIRSCVVYLNDTDSLTDEVFCGIFITGMIQAA